MILGKQELYSLSCPSSFSLACVCTAGALSFSLVLAPLYLVLCGLCASSDAFFRYLCPCPFPLVSVYIIISSSPFCAYPYLFFCISVFFLSPSIWFPLSSFFLLFVSLPISSSPLYRYISIHLLFSLPFVSFLFPCPKCCPCREAKSYSTNDEPCRHYTGGRCSVNQSTKQKTKQQNNYTSMTNTCVQCSVVLSHTWRRTGCT